MRPSPQGLGAFGLIVAFSTALFCAVVVAAGEPPTLRLPPDRTYDGAEGSPGPVVFSHAAHVALAADKCGGCHPAPFHMLRPTGGFTHEEMNAGRQCGACHDGNAAAGVEGDCTHCHRERAP
jgi:c(7)-type cytochrome triheme protein